MSDYEHIGQLQGHTAEGVSSMDFAKGEDYLR